ncbi:MAG: type I methionyl aminopeptidase [Desulfonauticus sp.]|nr:type I methionyl aminopeptidase [Desulfonauticus sp.]
MKKYKGIFIKNKEEIGLMREANRIVAVILEELKELAKPGLTTLDLERKAESLCEQFKVRPAFKGYHGYPFILCCSVNEQVVHGFPNTKPLEEGDLLSVDMGIVYKGFYGDAARTFGIGAISQKARELSEVTEQALYVGIEQARAGNNLYDISAAIQNYVESRGFHVIKRFVGHGIGTKLHEKPEVPNFVPLNASKIRLKAGMTLAIEPMVAVGTDEVEILEDKWTAVTKDRSLAAHFEHTIAITGDGPIILSKV